MVVKTPPYVTPPTMVSNPDPSVLTTQNLQREIYSLRELTEAQFDGIKKTIEVMQKSIDLLPQLRHDEVHNLEKLIDEKFSSVGTQFKERDTRDDQRTKDSKVAIDAALKAASDAVAEQNKSNALAISKSEAGTTKQIDQIVTLIASNQKNTDDKIADIKDRQNSVEGRNTGHGEVVGWVFGAAGFLAALSAIVFNLLRH